MSTHNESVFYQGPGQLTMSQIFKDSVYVVLGVVLAVVLSRLPNTVVFGVDISAYYKWIWIVMLAWGGLLFGYHYILEHNKKYLITDNKIQCESGIIGKSIELIELYKVIDLSYESLLGRGQIVLHSTDPSAAEKSSNRGMAKFVMSIPNARQVFEQIQKALPAARERSKMGIRMDINH
jgi:hypothetical protein